ncbi:MAG: hypothetical protein JNL97_13640 [Verrucomicrobiales bacterium]|nr:hypothetical protein [Verrucomicrobiales bacterium]
MKPISVLSRVVRCVALAAVLVPSVSAPAFPPAPPHRIYGVVRDEFGRPLELRDASIVFEGGDNVRLAAPVQPGLEPGANYSIDIPMDSGVAPDHYKPSALRPTLPFRVRVKIGDAVYLPIEMTGDYARLGEPAASTRIDLTLGVDADGDGLPDAWEAWVSSRLGGGGIDGIRPGDDADGDGSSNLDEYLAGTFAFDPEGGFRLSLVPRSDGPPLLEFAVVPPRTYTVFGSPDLRTWTPVAFRISGQAENGAVATSHVATDVRVLRVEPVFAEDDAAANRFFKVSVR